MAKVWLLIGLLGLLDAGLVLGQYLSPPQFLWFLVIPPG
jgi:hypothetical protein